MARHDLLMDARHGDTVRTVPAGLAPFRIDGDGRLTYTRTCDIDVGDRTMWWMGLVPL